MPTATIYKSGDRYGDVVLTGKSYSANIKRKRRFVECLCSCGKIFYPLLDNLKRIKTKSCGCKSNYYNSINSIKHGLKANGKVHPIYTAYRNMKKRCYDKKIRDYKYHGGRGIKVCEEWLNNFQSFFGWSIANGWERGLQLDRHPNNETGDYEPNNCRWGNHFQQGRNKRNNILLNAFGEIKTMPEWIEDIRCAVGYNTLFARIKKYKWPHEKAIITISEIKNKCPQTLQQVLT